MPKLITTSLASLVLTAFFTVTSVAQNTFEGYAINTTGDTLLGQFTRYKQWSRSPQKVNFVNQQGKETELTPMNTRLFVVSGFDTYLSYKGPRMTDPTTLFAASNGFTPENEKEEVEIFLRKIGEATGISVWELTDSKRKNFFYQEGNGTPVELQFKAVMRNNILVEERAYRQQLRMLFQNYKTPNELNTLLAKLEYEEESFEDFMKQLAGSQARRKKPEGNGLFFFGGISYNSMSFHYETLPSNSISSSVSPVVGFAYFATTGRNFNRLFFFPSLRFYTYQHQGNNRLTGSSASYKSGLVASPALSMGYFFSDKPKVRAFAAGGLAMMVLPKNSVTFGGFVATKDDEHDLVYGVQLQAGVVLRKKLILSAYKLFPSVITNRVFYTGRHANLQLTVGYKF